MLRTTRNGLAVVVIAMGLVACGEGHDHSHGSHDHSHGSHSHGSNEHGSGEHAHGSDDGHTHEGEKHAIGEGSHDGVTIVATQVGGIGDEVILMVAVNAGHEKVKEIRAWVGAQDGRGSAKAKGNKMKGGQAYDFHIEAPSTLADDAATYIEVVTAKGAKVLPFKLVRGEGSGHDHDDHDHDHGSGSGEGSEHDDHDHGEK